MNRRDFMVLTGTTFAGIALPGCLTNYKQSGTRLKPPAAIKNFKSFRKHYPLPPLRSYTFLGTENSIDKPKVHVDGHINSWFRPQELVPWIEKSVKTDTFIHLSWLDNCPNTVVEAPCCGLPVLCTHKWRYKGDRKG